ncbi:MAG TPA: hypothetical protein VEC19_17565 [Usitatibacter sp.]|nr:hypothetical protein [Usitatibacter sp.]
MRAGMVRHPAEYPWSSFRANAMGYPCAFLTEHAALRCLDQDALERRLAYRALFDTPQPARELEIFRAALRSSLPAGSGEFVERMASASGRKTTRRNRDLQAA